LARLPALFKLARRAHQVVIQNLVLAAAVIVTLVSLDLLGSLSLPLAVAGHEGSTLVVALNGLRMLHRRAWRTAPAPARPAPEPAALRRYALAAVSLVALGILAAHQL
jgi:cation-transporting P-type ATPase J